MGSRSRFAVIPEPGRRLAVWALVTAEINSLKTRARRTLDGKFPWALFACSRMHDAQPGARASPVGRVSGQLKWAVRLAQRAQKHICGHSEARTDREFSIDINPPGRM